MAKKKPVFEIGHYDTEHEAAFAYNVAALVFEGPNTELNKGLAVSLKRRQEIEKEVLQSIRLYLEMPREQKWGAFPQLYQDV
jgi:hypothetical protein